VSGDPRINHGGSGASKVVAIVPKQHLVCGILTSFKAELDRTVYCHMRKWWRWSEANMKFATFA
jgi:hypothetical protein